MPPLLQHARPSLNDNFNPISDYLVDLVWYVYKEKCVSAGCGMSVYLNFTLLALLDITQICSTSDMIKNRFTHVSELRAISFFLLIIKVKLLCLIFIFFVFFPILYR